MIDIGSIPKNLRDELVNAFTLPIWYIAVYLFCPSVYNQGDIILSTSLCISLSLISTLVINISFSGVIEEDDEEGSLISFASFMFQALWLSLLIFFGYIFSLITDLIFEFYGFLLVYFFTIPILTIYLHIRKVRKKNKEN